MAGAHHRLSRVRRRFRETRDLSGGLHRVLASYAHTVAPLDFTDDAVLTKALAARDQDTFGFLVDRYHAPLVRLAGPYVPSRAVAEEVAQETWLAVIQGIDRFEGRSSLKTWLFSILVQHRPHARREGAAVDPVLGHSDC